MKANVDSVTNTGRFRALVGLLIGAGVCAGCAYVKQRDPKLSKERAQALLAAANENQITLFGDLGNHSKSTYFTRTAVSLRQHSFSEVGEDTDVDVDGEGRRIVFASTRHNVRPDLYIKAVDGVSVTQLTADPASDVQPVFSPDGKQVAFASNRSGNWDIWIAGVDGGAPIQVTSAQSDEVHPSWSPDGSQLVYCSLPSGGGQWELWLTHVGTDSGKRFIGYGLFPEWAPLADTILYQRARERGSRWFSIWTLALVGGEPRYPTEVAASATRALILPTWSPDGSRIAFCSTTGVDAGSGKTLNGEAGGVFDLWIMDADGREKVRLTDGHTANYGPSFSPTGRVFFTSNRSGHQNIWSLQPALSSDVALQGASVTDGASAATTGFRRAARTTSDRDDN